MGMTQALKFRFDREKAVLVMTHMVRALGAVDKLKLMKLVYLADKAHFLEAGHPITGDLQKALPFGPVPSCTLDLLNGNSWPEPQYAFQFLHVDDNAVMLRGEPESARLSPQEMATVDRIVAAYGKSATRALVIETHGLPEYMEAFETATSQGKRAAPIPYEAILRHAGDDRHFRLRRPVVADAALDHLLCPFSPGVDADL